MILLLKIDHRIGRTDRKISQTLTHAAPFLGDRISSLAQPRSRSPTKKTRVEFAHIDDQVRDQLRRIEVTAVDQFEKETGLPIAMGKMRFPKAKPGLRPVYNK